MRRARSNSGEIHCSFCGLSKEEAKGHIIAGPTVFICRDCIDMCVEVFATKDDEWRARTIEKLTAGLRQLDRPDAL